MLELVATSAFGLEAVVRYELAQLGFAGRIVQPGRILFEGDLAAICTTNLWLRTADRVGIRVAAFDAPDFDALFDTASALQWESWIPTDGAIPVVGRSHKSKLTSVPAVQRTIKRAIVDRLMAAHGVETLPETGARFAIEIALLDDRATLMLDTSGAGLHKRGYRQQAGLAPLKETLAAALVQLSFWKSERPLLDPFCGSGTIPIEAALQGRNIAPGSLRQFSCEAWPQFESTMWEDCRADARAQVVATPCAAIVGSDADESALEMARANAARAGVSADIRFEVCDFANLSSDLEHGCLIANPPYGERLGDHEDTEALHRSIPEVLRALPTWSHFILTAQPRFEALIHKVADRRRKLYNGRIECTYYQFHGPKPADDVAPQPDDPLPETETGPPITQGQVFGGLTDKAREQAEIFQARLRKRARHLRRWPTRRDIHCFRLYERDIPEVPLLVDRYEDHLHLIEYERPHDRDVAQHADWLELMQRAAAQALEVPLEQTFMKTKSRQRGLTQHEKADHAGYEIAVREGGLRFWVNLSDYIDTGLFLDHRVTREMVRAECRGRRVLNLFAYTGSFSVYAADGGAAHITTVDWSPVYLRWAQRNFELNDIDCGGHRFERSDARTFVEGLTAQDQYDVVVVDPPTFSNSTRSDSDWEIQRDHTAMLTRLLDHVSPLGHIYFSTNFRRFKLDEAALTAAAVEECTSRTIPEDFRNKRIHRCWKIVKS